MKILGILACKYQWKLFFLTVFLLALAEEVIVLEVSSVVTAAMYGLVGTIAFRSLDDYRNEQENRRKCRR